MLHTSRHTTRRIRAIRRLRLAIAAGVVLPWLCLAPPGCGKASSSAAPPDAIDSADLPGSDTPSPFEDTAADATDGADAVDAGPPCPSGQLRGLDGVCFPVGIQGCAALFLDEEGLCDPSMSKCPPGTIPKFDEGCVPVGIQGCVELFMEEDGLCHPRMDKCPPGTIPKFDEGCMPVGIQGCAALFMEDDGLCHPSMAKCPPGTIPKFDEGCVPVGIQGCAAVFLEEDGLCHPSMDKCPEDTFAVPQEGCVPIDGPDGCGEAPWGHVTGGPDTFYVDPSYAGGDGDGTKERPGHTIAAVLPLVPEGGRLVLAAGTYDEPLHLTKGIEVVGRCPSLVTLSGVQDVGVPVVVWVDEAAGVTIRGLAISGPGIGIAAVGVSRLTVQRVRVRETKITGVLVQGGSAGVALDHLLIEGTRPREDGGGGVGLAVALGARVTLTSSALVGNRDAGMAIDGDATEVEASGNLIEATEPRASDGLGRGLSVQSAARAVFTDNALVYNQTEALRVIGAGTEFEARRNLVAGTSAGTAEESRSLGVVVESGALATLEGNALLDNGLAGLSVLDAGTRATIRRNLIEGTIPDMLAPESGVGIWLASGTRAQVEDNALIANRWAALFASGPAIVIEGGSNLFEGTLPVEPEERYGLGVWLEAGVDARLTGDAVVANHATGVYVQGLDTSVELVDSLVADTRPLPSELGAGLAVHSAAHVRVVGSAFVSNSAVGMLLQGPDGVVEVRGNLVLSTVPNAADGLGGFGIQFSEGVSATMAHNAVVANHGHGLLVERAGTEAWVEGNLIENTQEVASLEAGGYGLVVQERAKVTLSGNSIVGNRGAGIGILEDPEVDAAGNLVEGTLPDDTSTWSGFGVAVRGQAATVSLAGNAIVGNHAIGLSFMDKDSASPLPGARFEARGNLVAGTLTVPGADPGGYGVLVFGAVSAALRDNAIVGNHGFGLVVGSVGGPGSVEVITNLVEDTVGWDDDTTMGVGVAAVGVGARLRLSSCAIRANRFAAVVVQQGAEAVLTDSLIRDTLERDFGDSADVGDGLLATLGADVEIEGSLFRGCARAGVVFDDCTGVIVQTASIDNRYGLVLQGAPVPETGEGNLFTGNSVTDVEPNGTLPVPDLRSLLPDAPPESP